MFFRYFSAGINGSYYDDNSTLTQSGTDLYTSGWLHSLRSTGKDSFLVEQGLLLQDDSRLYVPGTVSTSGLWKVGIGSPASRFYSSAIQGPVHETFTEQSVYKIAYVRYLPTGSLIGE